MEKNPVMECNKVRQKYCPNLFQDFAETKDPRHLSYTEYSNGELLGTVFYKGIAGIGSMQSMTYEFNREKVVKNLYRFMGRKKKTYLPHAVTINEYLERMEPEELQKVQQKQVYSLIRSKAFRKLNDGCLERHYNKGTGEETVNYHCDVPEAKIVPGESLVVSMCSEFIENNGEDAGRQKQKNISSELLKSFGQQITETEDISRNDTHSAPAN